MEYEKKKSQFDSAWSALSQVIKGSAIDPIPIDVLYKNLSDVTEVIDGKTRQRKRYVINGGPPFFLSLSPARFAYAPREYTQEDEQEDEEDVEAQRIVEDDDNEDDNGGGDDEEDGNGSEGDALKETKPWGCTKSYCPVALKERGVLWPGSPELACKYREMVYQFSSQEAKEKFMRRPVAYMNPKVCARWCRHFPLLAILFSLDSAVAAVSFGSEGFRQDGEGSRTGDKTRNIPRIVSRPFAGNSHEKDRQKNRA